MRVSWFSDLGSAVTEDVRSDTAVKRRMGTTKGAFGNMRDVLTNRRLSGTT